MSDGLYIVKVRLQKGGPWRTCGLNYGAEIVPKTDGYFESLRDAEILHDRICRNGSYVAVRIFHKGRIVPLRPEGWKQLDEGF